MSGVCTVSRDDTPSGSAHVGGARKRRVYPLHEFVEFLHLGAQELFGRCHGHTAIVRDEPGRELDVRLKHVHQR